LKYGALVRDGVIEEMTMADDTGSGGYDRATEGLDLARGAVETAGAKVADVGRHFGDAVERARQPETYGELLKNATRSAPIAMLITAFIAGAMFASRRRNY
jgi:hypothetical protein